MTGIFDSGVGGLASLARLRLLCPRENVIYLADRKNSPYGKRSAEDIKWIVRENIDRLTECGAQRVLIACCTASAVLPLLEKEYRARAVAIIEPSAAVAVRAAGGGPIGIISTEATARMNAFPIAINKISPETKTLSLHSSELVRMIEGGCADDRISPQCAEEIKRLCDRIKDFGARAVVLGCTHFTHVRETIERTCGIVSVSPAFVGAEIIAERIKNEEDGDTVYIE